MKTEPWIVIFPDVTADAPVYATEEAARAMVDRTNQETAGNVDAVAMPLREAAAAPDLLEALREYVRIYGPLRVPSVEASDCFKRAHELLARLGRVP